MADRDRRHSDQPVARRNRSEARLGHQAAVRYSAGIVDGEGSVIEGAVEGNLIITDSWPGQMRTVYGDHQRFFETYFATYPGNYFHRRRRRRDDDGYYWITGRVDDVLNVSGHRMGTAEVESALVAHPSVAEAAVVGYPHDIKGQGIYVYVTLMGGIDASDELRDRAPPSGCARKSGQSHPRILFNGPPACRRPVLARSCVEYFEKLLRTTIQTSAIPRRWPTRVL